MPPKPLRMNMILTWCSSLTTLCQMKTDQVNISRTPAIEQTSLIKLWIWLSLVVLAILRQIKEKWDVIMELEKFRPSLATPPYCPLLPAGLQSYIPYQHRAAVCRFELDVLPLHGFITYEFVPTSPAMSHMSGSSNFDSLHDGS